MPADPADGTTPRVGFIVNPIAGIGGRVGLKGSDGPDVLRLARERGGASEAGTRARRMLEVMRQRMPEVQLIVAPGEMGEAPARLAGFEPRVIGTIAPGATTADDTRRAARAMLQDAADLLVFVGGDGTARDILDTVGRSVVVLGVAAGVKVYSAVFGVDPVRAGELAVGFLEDCIGEREAEVLDLDEDAYREGRASPSLHGYLRVPFRDGFTQTSKEPSHASERASMDAIAADVVERMRPGRPYVLGPGTTLRAVAARLGVAKTLIGVDVVETTGLKLVDASESDLASLVARGPVTIIVTPIGGQGFLFGRGNPQIGPRVLARTDRSDILVLATSDKLARLGGRPFLVDTGDSAVDGALAGFVEVVTGYHERTLYRVA